MRKGFPRGRGKASLANLNLAGSANQCASHHQSRNKEKRPKANERAGFAAQEGGSSFPRSLRAVSISGSERNTRNWSLYPSKILRSQRRDVSGNRAQSNVGDRRPGNRMVGLADLMEPARRETRIERMGIWVILECSSPVCQPNLFRARSRPDPQQPVGVTPSHHRPWFPQRRAYSPPVRLRHTPRIHPEAFN